LDTADAIHARLPADGLVGANGKPNRLLVDERQVALALGRLLAQLQIPADDGGEGALSPRTARARRAAQSRWSMAP
jgi:hypothetical protein